MLNHVGGSGHEEGEDTARTGLLSIQQSCPSSLYAKHPELTFSLIALLIDFTEKKEHKTRSEWEVFAE